MQVEHSLDPGSPSTKRIHVRWQWVLLAGMLAIAAAGGKPAMEFIASLRAPAAFAVSTIPTHRPGWAGVLSEVTVSGWSRIQQRFRLQDSTIRDAIELMASNARYSTDHPLFNLSVYPAQIERAFGLIERSGSTASLDLDSLKNLLGANVLASTTLPDQNPRVRGGQSEEVFEDLVVFAAVEHLHTVRGDPRSVEIVRALRNGGTSKP